MDIRFERSEARGDRDAILLNMPAAGWQTFLTTWAGAAAGLTGLVFVAVSLNLTRIMAVAGLPGRAAESLVQLMQVFFVGGLALIPRQTAQALGWEVIAIGAGSWMAQTVGHVGYMKIRRGHPWSWLLIRVTLSQVSTIPICVAGIGLVGGMADAIYWIVPGFVFSFAAGLVSAWVLLIEILR